MTHNEPLHQFVREQGQSLAQANGDNEPQIAERLRNHDDACVTLNVRRQQSIPLQWDGPGKACLVLEGLLVLECIPTAHRRRILKLFYPGNIVRTCKVPKLEGLKLVAVTPVRLLQMKWPKFEEAIRTEKTISDHFHQQLVDQGSRTTLHESGFGVLTGEERVTALLVEFALRLGRPTNGGVSFDIPLTRSEMADYLALNPDTMSRIMSRMKARGLVLQLGRGRTVVQNVDALLEQCPISPALVALHNG